MKKALYIIIYPVSIITTAILYAVAWKYMKTGPFWQTVRDAAKATYNDI